MHKIGALTGALIACFLATATATAGGEGGGDGFVPVTLCHASPTGEGNSGPANQYELITVDNAGALNGHQGHPNDIIPASECPTPPPIDYCDTLEGVQVEDEDCPPVTEDIPVTAGVTFTEATCTTPPAFHLIKSEGVPFYNVEGPDLIDGHPAPGGTYTFTALPAEGYVVEGDSVFVHTFAATPTDCGANVQTTGTATAICLLPAGIYQVTGSVDGQPADKTDPNTLPGNTNGTTNITVTRGDTSVRTTVTTLGDCGTTTTVTVVPPPTVVTPPPVVSPKPVVKPKPKAKPPVKHKKPVKAKPKPKKHKPNKKPHKAPQTLSL